MPLSKRGQAWAIFSDMVAEHIENYTVPQYGDDGDDGGVALSNQANYTTAPR